MKTPTNVLDAPGTLADLLHRLGDVPLERILARPAPGTATEKDLIAVLDGSTKRLCELVEGVLVEKPMGTKEAQLALFLAAEMLLHAEEHDLGIVLGADGALRLLPGLVRVPDISFLAWDRLPGGALPDEPVAGVVPDLAVEVLSEGNTRAEMERKLQDYFKAGVRLVWIIQPKTETAAAYTSPTKSRRVGKEQALDGGGVLPGFSQPLKELFARARRKKRKSR
jgi:Uma2 family endonuclease